MRQWSPRTLLCTCTKGRWRRHRRLGLALAAAALGCNGHGRVPDQPAPPAVVVAIPTAPGPIAIDGKSCADLGWRDSFESPLFQDSRGHTAPFTRLRAAADEDNLYVEVYVADADIRSQGDLVRLTLGPVVVELTPKGVRAPPGVRSAVDTDDTIDNARSNDEEWVNEVAIPWALLGSHEVSVRAFRVDVGVGGPPHALAWPRSGPALFRFGAG
jgi:hypothetical protein